MIWVFSNFATSTTKSLQKSDKWQMTNWAVISAQVVDGRTIWWWIDLEVSRWVYRSYVQDAYFITPHVPAKASIKQWNEEQQPMASCYNVNSFASLAFLPLLFNLFPSHEFNTAPSQCCSLKAYSRSCTGVNWDNCVVWGWATTMLVQLFLSWGNRVAQGFHGYFTESRVLEMYPGTAQRL